MFAVCLAVLAAAQAETTHEVAVGPSANWLSRTDLTLSPLNYSGLGPGVDLTWTALADRATTRTGLSFSPGTVSAHDPYDYTWNGDSHTTGPSWATLADIQVSHGRRIRQSGFVVGATSANHFEDLNYSYAFTSVSNYFGALELAPWASWRTDISRRSHFEVEGWLPLVSWVARNPYAIHSSAHLWNVRDVNAIKSIFRYIGTGSVRTLDDYQAAHLRLAYTFDLSDRWGLVTRARLDGFHFNDPAPVVEWQLGLNAGVQGRF